MLKISLIFRQGEIVIINLPFSDLSGSKNRPALIISSNEFNKNNQDIIALKITSSYFNTKWELKLVNNDLKSGKLKKQSYIDTGFIYTIEKSLITHNIGSITNSLLTEVKSKLKNVLNL